MDWVSGKPPFSRTFYADKYGQLKINDKRLWLTNRFREVLRLLPVLSKEAFLGTTVFSGECEDVKICDVVSGYRPAILAWDALSASLKDATNRVRCFWRVYGTALPEPYVWDCRRITGYDLPRLLTLSLGARLRRADINYHYETYSKDLHVAHIAPDAWYVWADSAIWEH
jgi:hypothetical protein